jgi:hypothetical protein
MIVHVARVVFAGGEEGGKFSLYGFGIPPPQWSENFHPRGGRKFPLMVRKARGKGERESKPVWMT